MKTIYIGRNAGNDIVLNEPSISGRHAEITIGDDGQIVLTDYSTNGTYVNGMQIHHSSQLVNYGDSVVFPGGVQLDWNQVAGNQGGYSPAQNQYTMASTPAYGAPAGGHSPIPNTTGSGNSHYEVPAGGAKLEFGLTFSEGFTTGLRNALSLLGTLILYVLTIWIPYINIGTTIAMASLPARWAEDKTFNPLEIFASRYRRVMWNYMLASVLTFFIYLMAFAFMFFPLYVAVIALSLVSLYVIEKDMTPIDAIQASNNATYGNKWLIFGIYIVFGLGAGLVFGLLSALVGLLIVESGSGAVGVLMAILLYALVILMMSIWIGVSGSIWRQLKENA